MEREMVERIERAENEAFTSMYRAASGYGTSTVEVDGVAAVWSRHDDDPGYNCVINLDIAIDPTSTIGRIEAIVRETGAPVLGIDGSPAVVAAIGDERIHQLGFARDYQEHMWGRRLSRADLDAAGDEPAGPVARHATRADAAAFARVLNIGYELPEESVRGHVFASTIEHHGWFHYLVEYDGQPGSASALYVSEGVAQLFVATTMPDFRGRGGQGALIRQRLRDALDAGADLATAQTGTENASPRNMERRGFELLYTRWIYAKRLGD